MNTRTIRIILFGVLLTLMILTLGFMGYGFIQEGTPVWAMILNLLILSIPLSVVCFSIWLIVESWQQHRHGGLSARMARFLYLTPRIAGILVAFFTGLFSLDVFDMEGTIWMKIGAFLLHSLPSIAMIALLVVAWRREWVGALGFGLIALAFFAIFIAGSIYGVSNMLFFFLPMALIAFLFWLNWRWHAEIRNSRVGAA